MMIQLTYRWIQWLISKTKVKNSCNAGPREDLVFATKSISKHTCKEMQNKNKNILCSQSHSMKTKRNFSKDILKFISNFVQLVFLRLNRLHILSNGAHKFQLGTSIVIEPTSHATLFVYLITCSDGVNL